MTLKLRTKPYPHQRKAVVRALNQGNHAFFFEPRCGKSKAALDAISIRHHRGEVNKVVILAPLTVLSVWEDQIMEHLSVPAQVLMTGEVGWNFWPSTRSSKKDYIKLSIYLVNYDKFSRRGNEAAFSNDYVQSVEKWNPDLIVFDESHRVKSAGAVRSQSLWRMIKRLRERRIDGMPHVYLLTGTPNPKGYIDLFSQFRILDDSIFGTSKQGFEERYCQYGLGRRKYQIVKYLNKSEMLGKIKEHSSIVTAAKVGLANVESFNRVRVKLPPTIRAEYKRLAEEAVLELEDDTITATNAGVLRLRLLQLAGGYYPDGSQAHSAKIHALQDLLEDLHEQQQAVVVYARFLPEVDAIERVVDKVGYNSRRISGHTSRSDRAKAIRGFRDGRVEALVFQVDSGSLGLDLSRAAETIYYSLPDGWEAFYQSTRRVCGPKQKRPVRHNFILAQGTVDSAVLDTLRNKRDMHKEMMRSPRSFLLGL